MVKVDYNSDIYSKIVTDPDDKIIGWLDDDENPVAYDFDGKRIGRAIVEYEAKDTYKNRVYSKIKENDNGLYEPAKDSKEIGKVTGNITRVMFEKVNDDFKLHLALIAEMMKYDTYDDYHDDNDEKNSSVYQYKKGMNKFFDSHINNQQLGLDSGSIEAAKGQFWGDIDNSEDAESVTNLLKDAIKQNNLLTGETVELDKDGNIEVHKINLLLLNYYVLIVNMAILLAMTVVAVLANKKKKGNDPASVDPITAVSATGDVPDLTPNPTNQTSVSATGDVSNLTPILTNQTAVSATGDVPDLTPNPTNQTSVSATGDVPDLTPILTNQTAVPGQKNIGSLLDEYDPFIFNSAFSSLINSLY